MKVEGKKSSGYQTHLEKQVALACTLMAAHIEKPLSVQSVAKAAGFSEFHFYRVFKLIMGTTPNAYYISIRLTHAAHLLLTTQMPVFEIAYLAGFGDAAAFNRAFTKKYKSIPTSFRLKQTS